MKVGLVLEGGGMRGLYTAGVLDAFLEAGIKVDGVDQYQLERFLVLITFLTSPKEPCATTNDHGRPSLHEFLVMADNR